MIIDFTVSTIDIKIQLCLNTRQLNRPQSAYSRKINGKYIIPQNVIQVSSNTVVTVQPKGIKWKVLLDGKIKKSCMCAWHPEYGLSHGVCK